MDSLPFSIPVSMLRQYVFCPRIPFFYLIRKISAKEPPWVETGIRFHERQIMLNKRRNLSRYAVGENGKATITHNIRMKSGKLKMHGICDGILHDGLDNDYILEFKSQAMKTINLGTAIQMTAYAMIHEEMTGKRIERGFLLSGERGKTLELIISESLRTKVTSIKEEILSIAESGLMPASPADERKCGQCEFLNFCGDRY